MYLKMYSSKSSKKTFYSKNNNYKAGYKSALNTEKSGKAIAVHTPLMSTQSTQTCFQLFLQAFLQEP